MMMMRVCSVEFPSLIEDEDDVESCAINVEENEEETCFPLADAEKAR
jgi:hypothetical protein